MCSSISRFSLGLVAALAALCCPMIGCASRPDSPARYGGYAIYAADPASEDDLRWAEYLAAHLARRTELSVACEGDAEGRFLIGVRIDPQLGEDYRVERRRGEVCLAARSDEAMLWLQYRLMKSLGQEDARIEASDLPPATVGLRDTSGTFAFAFRSIYLGGLLDADRAGIAAVHDVERDWALWGHAAGRIAGVLSPEVCATVDGKPYGGQLCFSSEELYRRLETYIVNEWGEHGPRQRFMIAPEDDPSVCTCARCLAAGNTPQNGTPAAARLVNRLAARFPNHTFYLLAYLGTAEPPAERLPSNAGAVLSALDLPLKAGATEAPAGSRFADRLERWRTAADSLFVWDYVSNFDDYLTPFPVWVTAGERLAFYRRHGVQGLFLNGSGGDYAAFDDAAAHALSALLLDPAQRGENLVEAYLLDQYPLSGGLLAGYCRSIGRRAAERGCTLEMYGGIRHALAAYLDAEEFVALYDSLQRLLPRAKEEEQLRLRRLVGALSYTRLEIARIRAAGPLGAAEDRGGALVPRPETEAWLVRLGEAAARGELIRIGEAGPTVTEYLHAWSQCIPDERNFWLNTAPAAVSEPDEGYCELGLLTDGFYGFALGYHYGWHISSRDMEVELPGGPDAAGEFRMRFLHDPRHRIRAPRCVELLADGAPIASFKPEPDASGRIHTVSGLVDLRGTATVRIRVLRAEGGRTQIATDEIQLIAEP